MAPTGPDRTSSAPARVEPLRLPAHGAGPALAGTAFVLALGIPAFTWMHDRGLLLGDPVVLALLLALNGLVAADAVQRWIGVERRASGAALRLGVGLSLFMAFAWTAGWSALVPLAGMLLAVVQVERAGSQVWRLATVLTAAATLVGQGLVQLGLVPSVPVLGVSHAVAGVGLLLGTLTVMIVGISVADRERFELALARTEARVRAMMDSSNDVLTVSDADGVLTYVSPAVQRAMGYAPEDLVGRPLLDLVDSEHAHHVRQQLHAVMARGDGTRTAMDVLVVHATHERRWYEWNVRNLLDDPLVEGLVVDQRDVTERLLHSEALAHAAAHDDLTGLANRRELMRQLTATMPQATRGSGVAVLFLDLDRFKEVNDTFGHAAGDDLLVVVARRLRSGLRPHDHLARLGGDEFCAVLTEVRDAGEVAAVVARLEEDLARPVALAGRRVSVSASIGVAMTTDGEADAEALFARADAEMYRVKHSRRQTAGPPPSAPEQYPPPAGPSPADD